MEDIEPIIAQRAESMAYLALTGNRLVGRVVEVDRRGYDLFVELKGRSCRNLKRFVVITKGRFTSGVGGTPEEIELPDLKSARLKSSCDVPVCLFIYFMDTNQGYYSWLREPAQPGAFRLQDNHSDTFHLLNAAAVDAIVSQVQQWYKVEKRRQAKAAPIARVRV